MDRAEVVELDAAVRTPAGEFKNCLKIEETSPLEPASKEFKHLCPGHRAGAGWVAEAGPVR